MTNTINIVEIHSIVTSDMIYRWGWLGFNCGSTLGVSNWRWTSAAKLVSSLNQLQIHCNCIIRSRILVKHFGVQTLVHKYARYILY